VLRSPLQLKLLVNIKECVPVSAKFIAKTRAVIKLIYLLAILKVKLL